MKKIISILFTIICLFCIQNSTAQQQMNPPQIVVVPDYIYCNKHGYMLDEKHPDYISAIGQDQNLKNVIEQIKSLIKERNNGFEIMNIVENNNAVETNELLAMDNGGSVDQSFTDALISASGADVYINVDFNINANGPQKSMHITMDARDAFTGNSISVVEGETRPSTSAAASSLVREAVYNKIDGFLNQLLETYQMWVQKGRPINIRVEKVENSKYNLRSVVGDGMVYEHVEDFLRDTSMNQRGVDSGRGNATLYQYPAVYFPMKIKGRRNAMVQLSANNLGANMQRYLASVGIECDFVATGLGNLLVIIK